MGSRLAPWLLALAGAALVLYLGSPTEDVYWSDFNTEAWPAFAALAEGDLRGFLLKSPLPYGGSMVVRAPFGALAGLFGLDVPGTFRLGAVPCLLALAALAAHLGARARAAHPGSRWWLLVIGLGAASPLAWKAVWFGHPEELLTAALAVGAVLAALGGRALLAGALLGAAVASKQWAVIAVLPVLFAAPRHHLRLLGAAVAAGAALLGPILLADPATVAVAQPGVASSAKWFFPQQLWWPLAQPGPQPGVATGPGWLAVLAKPLIVALTVPLSLLWLRRRGPRTDALALLALLLLARCALDPWNTIYYHLPLVVALLAFEVVDGRRVPILTLLTTCAVWLTFETFGAATGNVAWLLYLAWTLPLAAHLAWRLYRPSLMRLRAPVPAPA